MLKPQVVTAQYGAENGEWATYAGDLGGTKYSPLDQITRSNFSQLEIRLFSVMQQSILQVHPELINTLQYLMFLAYLRIQMEMI